MPRTPYHRTVAIERRADGSIPSRAERGRARAILNRLKARYPDIGTALDYDNPWQLLVVTVLSAQTTDENVNRVAPVLFARFPTPDDLGSADPEEVERLVYSTGFFRQKAESIIALSADLVDRFGGEVPNSLDDLVTLHVMVRLWQDEALRNELSRRGLERARGFSWEKTASQTLTAYARG